MEVVVPRAAADALVALLLPQQHTTARDDLATEETSVRYEWTCQSKQGVELVLGLVRLRRRRFGRRARRWPLRQRLDGSGALLLILRLRELAHALVVDLLARALLLAGFATALLVLLFYTSNHQHVVDDVLTINVVLARSVEVVRRQACAK